MSFGPTAIRKTLVRRVRYYQDTILDRKERGLPYLHPEREMAATIVLLESYRTKEPLDTAAYTLAPLKLSVHEVKFVATAQILYLRGLVPKLQAAGKACGYQAAELVALETVLERYLRKNEG